MRNWILDLRILRSDALPLSHIDFMLGEVYHEGYMTHVLHTARISNISGVMFVGLCL